jgi:hypothetical protein
MSEEQSTPGRRDASAGSSGAEVADLAQADRDIQCLVLNLAGRYDQRPWSIEEIVRVLTQSASRIAVEDAVAQLRDIGLLNQSDRLIFASQASAHIDRLGMLML